MLPTKNQSTPPATPKKEINYLLYNEHLNKQFRKNTANYKNNNNSSSSTSKILKTTPCTPDSSITSSKLSLLIQKKKLQKNFVIYFKKQQDNYQTPITFIVLSPFNKNYHITLDHAPTHTSHPIIPFILLLPLHQAKTLTAHPPLHLRTKTLPPTNQTTLYQHTHVPDTFLFLS